MKTNAIILAALIFFSCAQIKACREKPEPEPQPQPEPPVYEEVVQTIHPEEFGFREDAGVEVDDDVLELRRTSKGVVGNVWYSLNDSGASSLVVRMRKSRSGANPKLAVHVGEAPLFSVAPVDTFSNYASVVFPLKPSIVSLRFEPDQANVKSDVKLYVKWLKVTTKRIKKP